MRCTCILVLFDSGIYVQRRSVWCMRVWSDYWYRCSPIPDVLCAFGVGGTSQYLLSSDTRGMIRVPRWRYSDCIGACSRYLFSPVLSV